MQTVLFIALIISLIGVLLTLGIGLVLMTAGGKNNKKYGNRLMRARLIFQAIALIIFALLLMSGN